MTDYRKKPVTIQAALFDGRFVGDPDPARPGKVTPETRPEWFPALIEDQGPGGPGWGAGSFASSGDKIYIGTLEGTMTASAGDWIIRGVQGELYPCKPAIFAATYERVD